MTQQPIGGVVLRFGQPDRLRKAREYRGLSQEAFAEEIGISRQSVSNYETGVTRPNRPVLAAWAMASGVSLGWITTGEGAEGPGDGPGIASEGYDYGANATAIELMQYRSRRGVAA